MVQCGAVEQADSVRLKERGLDADDCLEARDCAIVIFAVVFEQPALPQLSRLRQLSQIRCNNNNNTLFRRATEGIPRLIRPVPAV